MEIAEPVRQTIILMGKKPHARNRLKSRRNPMKFKIFPEDKKALCRQAPEFRDVVRQIPLDGFECEENLFQALVRSILSQQLSVKVANTIYRRVEQQLGIMSPENIMTVEPSVLRACGVSVRKIEYIQEIASAVCSGKVNLDALYRLPDAEVIGELVKLKGVGVWTAEMLLIFALGRRDVLSFKDLGIRRGIMLLNNLERLTLKEFDLYRKRYSPYGTLVSLYLWRIKDGGLSFQ